MKQFAGSTALVQRLLLAVMLLAFVVVVVVAVFEAPDASPKRGTLCDPVWSCTVGSNHNRGVISSFQLFKYSNAPTRVEQRRLGAL